MSEGLEQYKEKNESAWSGLFAFDRYEILFLFCIYLVSLYLRLAPRLDIDPHLLTFQGDIWYRLAIAQYVLDNHALPGQSIRYIPYGYVPMWYPPLSPLFFASLSYISGLDIATVSSRIMPFFESFAPLSLYPLARYLYNKRVATISTIAIALTPSFIFWSGISDPQSFTLFMIPLLILVWMVHSKSGPSNIRLFLLGVFLGLNFLIHLSYFLEALVLFMVTVALVLEKKAGMNLFVDLGKVVMISQLLTALWWLPDNLYWWWINALVTSSGLYSVTNQLQSYGYVAAVLGTVSLLYVTLRKEKHFLLIVLWALPLILETQNEAILMAINRSDLTWHTLAKPLEGFRFYCFLAQPLSLAIGVFIADLARRAGNFINHEKSERISFWFLLVLVLTGFGIGIQSYNLSVKFRISGLIVEEYDAAVWYRENSGPSDRIIADYYRSQMFAGVNGGRALTGGMFPLRNVDYPYIKAPGQVQNDLFILYNTSSAEKAYGIAKRYNATHIFYSDNMRRYGNLLSYYKKASDYGVDTELKKFEDERYFRTVYENRSAYGVVRIYETVHWY